MSGIWRYDCDILRCCKYGNILLHGPVIFVFTLPICAHFLLSQLELKSYCCVLYVGGYFTSSKYDRTEAVCVCVHLCVCVCVCMFVCLCAARCNNNLICAWLFILWRFDTLVPKPNVTSSSVRKHHKHYVPNALHKHWRERQGCVCVGLLEAMIGVEKRTRRLRLQMAGHSNL